MAGPPSEAAVKQRIIAHMNKDHYDSVAKYVEHYCKASRFTSRNAQISDITNSTLTIKAGGNTYTIPLEPPMANLAEARHRLIKMDQDCVEGLNISPITIRKFVPPRGFHAVVFVASLLTYVMLSRPENVQPGSPFHDYWLSPLRSGWIAQQFRLQILVGMLAIHGTEAYFMAGKMKKHSVPLFSKLWFLWVVDNFIEGFGAFQRLSALVAHQKAEKEKSKH